MGVLVAVVALVVIVGIIPLHRRDLWKSTLWLVLVGLLGLAALPIASIEPPADVAKIAEGLAVLLLAVIAVDAYWGRKAATRSLVGVAVGVAIVALLMLMLPQARFGGGLWLQTLLLLLITVVFGRLELQHRAGAGWILVGVLGWLLRIWLPYFWPSLAQTQWPAALLSLTMLITLLLAVRKQLRLTVVEPV